MFTMPSSLEKSTRNTLGLLEQMAANASLQDEVSLQIAIEQTEITEQNKALIMAENSQELSEALKLDRLITSVSITTPDEEDDEQEQEQQQPDQQEEKISAFG